ncbi:MAG: hypothetical protein K8R02_05920 [Anaerohalosphaeraceae bacterium]|nr:hypothetical protein [Anaerohalosphaeraceae bacterium]
MELEFKRDFQEVQKKWDAFWNDGKLARPLMNIIIPKQGVQPVEQPSSVLSTFDDYDKVIDQILGWAQSHEFIGEAIPSYRVQFASDHFSALLGAELVFHKNSPNTGWITPFVEDWDDVEIKLNRDGIWWEKTIQRIRAFRKRLDGKVLVTGPNLQGGLDCLSAIRDPQKLAMDLVMCPDKIKKALKQVTAAHKETLELLQKELDIENYGDMTRHQMYSSGSMQVPQCDFSCMISNEMFREFGVEPIREEVKLVKNSTYHLDGPDAVHHLEAICEIDGIDSIQWQPGAGEAMEKDWTNLYKKIDSFGKRQVLGGGGVLEIDHEYIKKLCGLCDKTKLFFVTTASSKKQAEDFLESLEKIA